MLNLLSFKQHNIAFDLIFLDSVNFPFIKYLLDIHLTYINNNTCARPYAVPAIRYRLSSPISRGTWISLEATLSWLLVPRQSRNTKWGLFQLLIGLAEPFLELVLQSKTSYPVLLPLLCPAGVRPTSGSESSPHLLLPFPVLLHI